MNAEIQEVVVELEIKAPRDKVWEAMLNQMAAWWPKDALALEGATEMQFEPWAGGRQFVTAPDGQQLLWGTVLMILPSKTIDIVGYTMPEYGGPAMWLWRMEVEDGEQGTTKLTLANSIIGRVTEESREDVTKGWTMIFGGLKEYCEA